MKKLSFSDDQKARMLIWRNDHISSKENGFQNGKDYPHIIPKRLWKENLWIKIREELSEYLDRYDIQSHTGTHNLVSSWITCANLYFVIQKNEFMRDLMLKFLKEKVSDQIVSIVDIQLEFAFPEDDQLHPSALLGEKDGNRGSGQTSPDIAFIVKTISGNGLILTENKFLEHSFYACSGRRTNSKGDHEGNPDPARCMIGCKDYDHQFNCHQTKWGRKYWSLLNLSVFGKTTLKRCPAATAGYQLFRQQALAEGIAQSGRFSLVASTVAYDERNNDLIGCLKSTGVSEFPKVWGKLFEGKALFKTWTHQEWVQYIRDNQKGQELNDWLGYVNERYGY
jgi:hypothetical protein